MPPPTQCKHRTADRVARDQTQLSVMASAADRLASVEMRLGSYSRGVAVPLYEAARAAQGGVSLSLLAATTLHDAAAPGRSVVIATGAGHPTYMPAGETDGPLGAVALARALQRGYGVKAVFATASLYELPLRAAAEVAGLDAVSILPVGEETEAAAEAAACLDRHQPLAVVAVEALAPNAAGIAHTASGLAAIDRPALEELVREAARRGIVSIGIGDNGNEIGFGLIESDIRRIKPFGDCCNCPCRAGIASAVATDILVAANVSNWGAYAVTAMLAALSGDPTVLHTPDLERRMLEAAVEAGACDGSTGSVIPYVDGSGLDVQQAVLTLLAAIVENGLIEPPSRPF